MEAWKRSDGRYRLRSSEGGLSETYACRNQIKAAGGRWDPKAKHWTVPAEAVDELNAQRVYGVVVAAYCHTPEQFAFATQSEVDAMRYRNGWCGYCDSPSSRPAILEVLGEADVARDIYQKRSRP